MEFKDIQRHAIEIRKKYDANAKKLGWKKWSASDYFQGFVGDVGDLGKLIMARNKLRQYKNQEEKLAHELSDCLWSILVLADELDIDLEKEFLKAKLSTLQKKKGHP